MRRLSGATGRWAQQYFGKAELGDSRRTARLLLMGARAAENPDGRISAVFTDRAEREGAYDLLEGGFVQAADVVASIGDGTAAQCSRESYVYVPIDGSSLGLVDGTGCKGFGSVGALAKGGGGLKVITAEAVSPQGVPIGVLDQQWWARVDAKQRGRKQKRRENLKRQAKDKETQHWLDAIEQACKRAQRSGTKIWFELDREADNKDILLKLTNSGHRFTVRSSWDRRVEAKGDQKRYLRRVVARQAVLGEYDLEVEPGPNRTARNARMVVRTAQVVLQLRDRWTNRMQQLAVTAVWARETGRVPPGEKRLDWLLLTNAPVTTIEQAMEVIRGYSLRWRIEELHKTWKSGDCNVESTQLRDAQAVMVWASILAAVAVRVERLKILSRTEPQLPATVELSSHEVLALVLLKGTARNGEPTASESALTIAQAVQWIAELGGYTGKSSGGAAGSITIGRGLEKLRAAARLLHVVDLLVRLMMLQGVMPQESSRPLLWLWPVISILRAA